MTFNAGAGEVRRSGHELLWNLSTVRSRVMPLVQLHVHSRELILASQLICLNNGFLRLILVFILPREHATVKVQVCSPEEKYELMPRCARLPASEDKMMLKQQCNVEYVLEESLV